MQQKQPIQSFFRRTQSAKQVKPGNQKNQQKNQPGTNFKQKQLNNNFFENYQQTQINYNTDNSQLPKIRPYTSKRPNMPPLNVKTLKYLNNNDALEIIPNEVIFRDIEQNQTYEMLVFVQNLSKIPKRIKILQPKTQRFRVDYDTQGAIAAGLTMKLLVILETSSIIDDYSDTFQILYETQVPKNNNNNQNNNNQNNNQFNINNNNNNLISQKNVIEVPLRAFKPQPQLQFETSLNLGFVSVNKDIVKPVKFFNTGSTPAKVSFDFSEKAKNIVFEPRNFLVQPNSSFNANLVFNSANSGVFRFNVEVLVEGIALTKKMDINVTAVEYNKFITDQEGSRQDSFEFGEIYFGSKKVIKGYLTNNTPQHLNFKISLRNGIVSPNEENLRFQTPHDQGLEMTEQIMKCFPLQGSLKPYSRIPVEFTCKSKVLPENIQFAKNYALKDELIDKKNKFNQTNEDFDQEFPKTDFTYTCIVNFDQDKESTYLVLNAKGIHPMLKFDKQILNFGECQVNDHREIMFHIQNKHKNLPVDINIPKMPLYKITPSKITLDPHMNVPFIVSFMPNNVGKYNKNLEITFIDQQYKIPLKALGSSTGIQPKRPKTRGPECLPSDFKMEKNYIDDNLKDYFKKQQNNNFLQEESIVDKVQLNKVHNYLQDQQNMDLHKETVEERLQLKNNKEKYTQYLRDKKQSRIQQQKDRIIQMRIQEMTQKNKIKINQDDSDGEKNARDSCPLDLQWEAKLNDQIINEPILELPQTNDPLFVLKPISKHEPVKEEAFKHFNPDPDSQIKKIFGSQPLTHKDTRDIHLELDGDSLQKIFAGPKQIEFGEIYVKSTVKKCFTVKNDLRNAIKVQLQIQCPELKDSYQKPQIIPSSETAKFELVLCSQGLDDQFQQPVKYIINGRHEFQFLVTAKITQVKLDLNKQIMKFAFSEENNYMETSETLKISNHGNAPGKFQFDQDSKIFFVHPLTGEVPGKIGNQPGTFEVNVTYRPQATIDNPKTQGGVRNEEDKLILRVQDGQDQTIKCLGTLNEAKCVLKQQKIDLGEILVSKEEIRYFQIKNTSRIPAIFIVLQEQLPECCTVTPKQGRIPADGVLEMTLKYCNNNPRIINEDIPIMLRGGKILRLPFYVQTVIPDIQIKEENFDFGKITLLGNSSPLRLTITNYSNIDTDLSLDMRGEDEHPDINMVPEGIECLTITPIIDDDTDESILKSVQFDDQEQNQMMLNNQNGDNMLQNDDFDNEDSESSEEVEDKNRHKLYNFVIRAKQTLKFELRFSPREEKNYHFDLPLALQRYGGKLPGIQRQITCQGLRPKFYADPPIVEFPRKIISNTEKMFPVTQEVILQNVGLKSMDWKVKPETFENDEIFSIHPTEGRIEAQLTFRIKVSFNPKVAGHYEKIIPIFIDDPDVPTDQPSMELVMKGDSAFPKLLFDRKEVILPTVPLNVESKCVFKIYNDGYENLTIDHKVIDELQKLNINLNFPEGKTLGVAKNRIKVEATFSSKAPISYTTKIIFSDQTNQFTIPISGTADNSILTNYQFMLRNKGDYNYIVDEKGTVQLAEDAEDSFQDSMAGSKRKYTPSITSKTYSQKSLGRTGLGYPPIPKELLDFSKEIVKEWLNGNVLTTIIQNFPENVVEHNGEEIFQLLIFLTGQSKLFSPMQKHPEKQMKRVEKAQLLFTQYDDLIRYLKTQGALLNHIRPQYLLSHSDYLSYIKNLPKEENFYTHSTGIKLSYQRFQYISAECWISLFYQILKMYYLSKVSPKIFKNVPNFNYTTDKQACPDYYTHGSNVYNAQEGLLLKWLEMNNEMQNGPQFRLTNFEHDFAQGQILVNLIKNYVSPLTEQLNSLFLSLKSRVETEEEYLHNATVIHKALKEIGLATTFKPSDLIKFSARENLLFLLQLYNALPNYIPKQSPIIFSCVLGESVKKSIELTNPTAKPISYWVKYDGSLDFKPEFEDCFQIQPKSTFKFTVTFNSRVSVPVKGRLTFTNKKETNVQASALVFELRSQITGRISIKPWEIDSHLYESKEFNIQVQNNFDNYEFGEFQIYILHQKEIDIDNKLKEESNQDPKDKKKKANNGNQNHQNSLNKRKKQNKDEEQFSYQETPFIPSFFCKVQNIKLKKKATYNLSLNFVPMVYETQKCYIIFSDPVVGEFQHEITGTVKLPEDVIEIPRTPITPPVFVDEQRNWPLQVPFLNKQINNARRIIESWQIDKKIPNKKDKDLKMSQYQPIIPKQPFKFPKQLPDSQTYEVELIQPPNNAIIAPKVLSLHNPKTFAQTKTQQNTEQTNNNNNNINNNNNQNSIKQLNNNNNLMNINSPLTTEFNQVEKSFVSQTNQFDNISLYQTPADPNFNNLNLLFNFKNPIKDYRCDIILKNSTLTDIRRYQLTLTACPKPIKAIFELNAPAKEMIVQEIPIQNNTEKDWIIKVQLTQPDDPELHYFYCQKPPQEGMPFGKDYKEFVVKKQTTGQIPLIFCPQKPCKVEGKLLLTNPLTNDVFDYELKGEGEDPLAQDHIVVNCVAKQTKVKEITINNPYKDKQLVYKVQTDLIGASGDDTFIIPAKKKRGTYKLNLTPTLSGQYTGSITFTEPDGTYIWYTVLLNIESPPPQKCLDLTTSLRKAIAVDIELSNPYVDAATFEVLIEGEGLMGDQFFSILPLSTSQYELMYMPLKPGVQKGSIAFVNEKLGEIWYELNLVAEDSGVIRLPQLKCELGKTEQHEINLENPSEKEQRVKIRNNNPQNFEIHPEEIIIPPMEAVQANIRYLPSALDTIQQAEVILETEEIGKWHYLCFGLGVPPTPFEPKILTIGLNKDYSTVIHFKNPFKEQIQIKVILDLEDQSTGDVIKLLKKNQEKITLNGQQTIQIPFTFTPTEIREYKANIILQMNEKIQWVYPIIGVTESLASGLLKVFKVRCRNNYETEFDVHLPGISSITPGHDDQFNFEIAQNAQKDSIFKKIFNIQCVKNTLDNPDDFLKFKVKFNPLKPFKQTVDFIIKREIGGLWKFKFNLESTPPVEDDIIIISSPLHKTSSVSFRLTNRKKQYTQFQAKFTPDSDAEFGVTPKIGTLEPLGTDGSKFTISFTPVQYGKTREAKLIIETEEIYWSYIIKGTLPKYIPPISQGVVRNNFMGNSYTRNNQTIANANANENQSQIQQQQKKPKKNFLTANIKKTKEESSIVHQMNEQSRIHQNNQSLMQNQNNRSSLSPPFNNNNDINKSKLSQISQHNSRMFTAPGGMRKKLQQ